MDTVDSDESLDEPFRRDSPRSCAWAAFATASGAADTAVPVNQSPPTLVGAVEGGVLGAHHGRWQSDSSVSSLTSGDAASPTEWAAPTSGATDRIYTPAAADIATRCASPRRRPTATVRPLQPRPPPAR
jgi:hypothetical protein